MYWNRARCQPLHQPTFSRSAFHPLHPKDKVLLKTQMGHKPWQLAVVLQTIHTALKLARIKPWIYGSGIKESSA